MLVVLEHARNQKTRLVVEQVDHSVVRINGVRAELPEEQHVVDRIEQSLVFAKLFELEEICWFEVRARAEHLQRLENAPEVALRAVGDDVELVW